ncbi:hypothetical protein BDN72DRAFT_857893 [Pluteus cervinus]|uniref:Uncharacterized protein n=1 Tax=Pluteus cervinus TaxID=181527 RepID=A0ACD3AUH6_9AGAR|nr:hypothetical protein BDN72DRAFT_857893 [Pluteus cervinus]
MRIQKLLYEFFLQDYHVLARVANGIDEEGDDTTDENDDPTEDEDEDTTENEDEDTTENEDDDTTDGEDGDDEDDDDDNIDVFGRDSPSFIPVYGPQTLNPWDLAKRGQRGSATTSGTTLAGVVIIETPAERQHCHLVDVRGSSSGANNDGGAENTSDEEKGHSTDEENGDGGDNGGR